MKTRLLLSAIPALTFALAACGSGGEPAGEAVMEEAPAPEATATLMDTEGNDIGTATASEVDGVLTISLTAHGLPEGEHGAHIHQTGDCSAADFTSAGGHWNPGETNHGMNAEDPKPHAGDLPNLVIDAEGNGTLEATSTGTFAEMMDDDGAAVIIHADPDDYETQPTGNAGARLACGVFQAAS